MKKVLIIRFSSIGDIVLTTPVIRCIKHQIQDVEIHYFTKKSFSNILINNPYISKVHSLDDNFNDIINVLKNEHFDYIIDLHKNIRTQIVKKRLRVPSFSFQKLNLEKWLFVNLKLRNIMPKVHIVDRYFGAVKSLGVVNDNLGLDYFIDAKDKVDISAFPEIFGKGYIAIVTGGKHTTKQIPENILISICDRISTPILLLGGKEDFDKTELVLNKSTNKNIINACGTYNLNQSASIIAQAAKVITGDTGLMHIASAFKKEIISLWGNTVPEFGMYPYLPKGEEKKAIILQVEGLKCRPCSKIGYEKCPKGHFKCMNNQNIETIINTINTNND